MDAKLRITLLVVTIGVVMLVAGLVAEWTPLRNAGILFLIDAPLVWIIVSRRDKESS